MFQNSCIRITAAGMVALLAACSASDPATSQATDSASAVPPAQVAAPAAEPEPLDTHASGTQEVAPPMAAATPATPADIPASAPAMKMFIDPVTGAPRDPTPAERAAMAGQRKAAQPATREEKMRNGGTAIMIEGEPTTPLKACTGADGKVAVAHDCESPAPAQQDSKGGKP